MDKETTRIIKEINNAILILQRQERDILAGNKKVTEYTTVFHLLTEEDIPPEL